MFVQTFTNFLGFSAVSSFDSLIHKAVAMIAFSISLQYPDSNPLFDPLIPSILGLLLCSHDE